MMTERPRSIGQYYATIPMYSSSSRERLGLSDPSVENCDIVQVTEIAKRSKFFYSVDGPPRYSDHVLEFRNDIAKVYFAIDRNTGRMFGAGAWWIRPHL